MPTKCVNIIFSDSAQCIAVVSAQSEKFDSL